MPFGRQSCTQSVQNLKILLQAGACQGSALSLISTQCACANSRAVLRQVLLDAGFVTICAGGGGVPVAVEDVPGGRVLRRRHGIEAVIDKVCKPEAVGGAAQGLAGNQRTCVWTSGKAIIASSRLQ